MMMSAAMRRDLEAGIPNDDVDSDAA